MNIIKQLLDETTLANEFDAATKSLNSQQLVEFAQEASRCASAQFTDAYVAYLNASSLRRRAAKNLQLAEKKHAKKAKLAEETKDYIKRQFDRAVEQLDRYPTMGELMSRTGLSFEALEEHGYAENEP